jgi:hypothetical protein
MPERFYVVECEGTDIDGSEHVQARNYSVPRIEKLLAETAHWTPTTRELEILPALPVLIAAVKALNDLMSAITTGTSVAYQNDAKTDARQALAPFSFEEQA